MKEAIERDRNLVALTAVGGVFILFLLAYFLPRANQLKQAQSNLRALTTTRQEVALLLPQVAQTAYTTQEPADNVRSWIAAEALKGLEKQVKANDGVLEGKGAKVQLRKLTPQQAAKFLSQLTKVRLVVDRMSLLDADRDGNWDMEIDVQVPGSEAK